MHAFYGIPYIFYIFGHSNHEVKKMQAMYKENSDGSLDILLYVCPEEMALDFEAFRRAFSECLPKCRRVALVRKVKIILAGTLAISLPFSFFAKVGADTKYAMSYVYFGTEEAQLASVSKAEESLSVVSPSYFNLTEGGTLSIGSISPNFIKEMKKSDIRIVPFLSNHWDRKAGEAALSKRAELAETIADLVLQYDLDGINVDIENVTEKSRTAYTDFLRLLRQKLPPEKEVSVAVAANPWGLERGWQGAYDYAALGEICDHILIMAYDEHYQGGEAGPVASLPFVEKSIQYALSKVEPQKIVLGIPFYGRIWGGELSGYGISMGKIAELQKNYETQIWYDPESKTPGMYLRIPEGTKGPVIGGAPLWPGTYTLHYENADSIKEKLALVAKYDLKGAGNWSAGQETSDVWDYYTLWLNARYFSDIGSHFAKDAILKVTSEGIMHGRGDAQFAPEAVLSRAEAAVICARILHLSGGTEEFPDVPASHWGHAAIASVSEAGIMTGYPDGSFRPEKSVTRAEMATILARIIEENYESGPSFSDVGKTHWAREEIIALAQSGVLEGYPDGSFRPENKINRGETAVILERIKAWLY